MVRKERLEDLWIGRPAKLKRTGRIRALREFRLQPEKPGGGRRRSRKKKAKLTAKQHLVKHWRSYR